MLLKLGISLTIYLCLVTTILSSTEPSSSFSNDDSSPSVLDTDGYPLKTGVDYYVRPAITDSGGYLTLISRNDSCPLYVGQPNVVEDIKFSIKFTPFIQSDDLIRENSDFKAVFQVFTTCLQSTAWKIGEQVSGRRLIAAGVDEGIGSYFRIEKDNFGIYHFGWCPTEVCPNCRLRCSSVGVLIENEKRLLALDGGTLPVIFERAPEISI